MAKCAAVDEYFREHTGKMDLAAIAHIYMGFIRAILFMK